MAKFSDIIGQEHLKSHMQNALRTGNISHAFIITGEKESGKEFIANIFAKTLLCESRNEENGYLEACDKCHSCLQADLHDNPDIIMVTHEKPNVITVDEIREKIRDDVAIKPYYGTHKIYIIPEGEKMNIAAQNALLKTLEEPPSYVIIIILTDNESAFLPTIMSRCVVLPMRPALDSDIKNFLMNQYHIPDYRAELCASFARGNVGKAILLSQNEDFDNMRKKIFSFFSKLKKKEIHEIIEMQKDILTPSEPKEGEVPVSSREMIDNYLDILRIFVRDVTVYKAVEESDYLIFRDELSYIREASENFAFDRLTAIYDSIDKAQKRIQANVNSDNVLELLILDIQNNL